MNHCLVSSWVIMRLNNVRQPLFSTSRDRSSPNKKIQSRKASRRANIENNRVQEGSEEANNQGLGFQSKKVVLLFLASYLGLGSLCFFLIRHQLKGIQTNGFIDALYFCVVTMTTVGYGDLVPNSTLAKLLACLFVFTGVALVGMILSKGADYFLEKQEILFIRALHVADHMGPAEVLRELEDYKVRYKFLMASTILVVLMIAGTVVLCFVEGLEFVDAIYCVCSTVTTLGYGDKSFSTLFGRCFAVFWILSSTMCLALFFMYLAELNTEGRQTSFVKKVLTRQLTKGDLEAADLDNDSVVR